jgi:hypothetical protein
MPRLVRTRTVIKRMICSELRAELDELGLSTAGLKAALQARLIEATEDQSRLASPHHLHPAVAEPAAEPTSRAAEAAECGVCLCEIAPGEGVQCDGQTAHLFCGQCFCRSIQHECDVSRRYEQDLPGSPSGTLPCPLFPSECDCGSVSAAKIFRAVAEVDDVRDIYSTAAGRVASARALRDAAAQQEREEEARSRETPLECLQRTVDAALAAGSNVKCPNCHQPTEKDDACMHMNSCPCGARFCYCCGRASGNSRGQCPRGNGGCDSRNVYLEHNPGWGRFAMRHESAGMGALHEFHRRKMKFFLRLVKQETNPEVWHELTEVRPDLLSNTPTRGRRITWEEIDSAEPPVFGDTTAESWLGSIPEFAASERPPTTERARRRRRNNTSPSLPPPRRPHENFFPCIIAPLRRLLCHESFQATTASPGQLCAAFCVAICALALAFYVRPTMTSTILHEIGFLLWCVVKFVYFYVLPTVGSSLVVLLCGILACGILALKFVVLAIYWLLWCMAVILKIVFSGY